MKLARILPIAVFLTGALALIIAACGGESKEQAPAATATATSEPTQTPTATGTAAPTQTPSPTPTPYNGNIARFKVPGLKIDAPIEYLAVDSTNALETPKGVNTHVGWYYIYDKPGRQNPDNLINWQYFAGKDPAVHFKGNAVFSAHVYYHNDPAPFVNLAKSKAGDEVVILMEDGREYKYKVITNTRYHRDTIPMGDILWPKEKPENVEWLTMITCGGELDSTGQEYVSRDVVVAQLAE